MLGKTVSVVLIAKIFFMYMIDSHSSTQFNPVDRTFYRIVQSLNCTSQNEENRKQRKQAQKRNTALLCRSLVFFSAVYELTLHFIERQIKAIPLSFSLSYIILSLIWAKR